MNVVLTTHSTPVRAGLRNVGGPGQLVRQHPDEDLMVIGGAAIHAQTISEADVLFLTQVFGEIQVHEVCPALRV